MKRMWCIVGFFNHFHSKFLTSMKQMWVFFLSEVNIEDIKGVSKTKQKKNAMEIQQAVVHHKLN
jgi:hypothetical protein